MTEASEATRPAPPQEANRTGERAEPAPEPRPEERELRCTICGLKACWTR